MSSNEGTGGTQRYRRVEVRVGVRISTIDPETDPKTGAAYFRTSQETCANVSRGGAYVETNESVSPGRRLLLELELPGGEPVQTLGRVAWTKAQLSSHGGGQGGGPRIGMGIEFLAEPDELRQLEKFLDDALPPRHGSPPTRA